MEIVTLIKSNQYYEYMAHYLKYNTIINSPFHMHYACIDKRERGGECVPQRQRPGSEFLIQSRYTVSCNKSQ